MTGFRPHDALTATKGPRSLRVDALGLLRAVANGELRREVRHVGEDRHGAAMKEDMLALGPALFGLLGAVAGALVAIRATATERRVAEDDAARDNVLELLFLVDVHGGPYTEGGVGRTELVVSKPPEPVAVLWERLRKARVDLLAARFRWPVTSEALGAVWNYIDVLRARDEVAQSHRDADQIQDAKEKGPSPTLSPDAGIAASARDAYFALSQILHVLDRSRRYRSSWRCARRFGWGSPIFTLDGAHGTRRGTRPRRRRRLVACDGYRVSSTERPMPWRRQPSRGLPRSPRMPRLISGLCGHSSVTLPADDPPAAVGALRQAMDSGEDSVAVDAALRLGDLLAGHQDAAGAMRAYRFAQAHGSADVSAGAADAIEQFQRDGQLWVPGTGRGNPVQTVGVRAGGERDG
jgi:hypothetical protein